jgi:hypothetical protein
MHTLLVSKSGWHQLLTCITIVALFLSGCADSGPPPLPPPPSEELRSQLGKIRISEGSEQLEMAVNKPVTNRGEGAAKGALLGLGESFATGLGLGQVNPAAIALIPILAPVFVVKGTVEGVQESQPEAEVKEFEKTFRTTIEELNVPETLRQSVADRISALQISEVTGPSDQEAPIIMEIVVKKIELNQSYWFDPYNLFITESTRLIRVADGMELYSHSLRNEYTGHTFSLDVWLAEDAAKLRQEVERSCHDLAVQIVTEIFYRQEGQKQKPNELYMMP